MAAEAAVRAARGAGHRHGRGAAHHPRVHPRPAATGRLRAGAAGPLRAASTPRWWPTSWPRPSAPSACWPSSCPIGRRRRSRGPTPRRSCDGSAAPASSWTSAPSSTATSRPRRRDASPLRRGNFMARARMMVLYDHSVTWRGLVVAPATRPRRSSATRRSGATAPAPSTPSATSTSARSASSAAIGVPDAIVRKAPSADLWPGQTDEAEVGFSYAEVDRILFRLVDRRCRSTRSWPTASTRDRRAGRPHGRGRRVQAPGAAHRQDRAAHRRHRLPLPASPPALDPWLRRSGRADPLRRGHAHRQPGDITLRALEVLAPVPRGGRGHAADAAPLGAPRPETPSSATTRTADRPDDRAPGAPGGRRGRRARDRRRHAAGERPRRGPRGGLGRGRRARRAHPGAVGRAGRARRSGIPAPRWTFEGFLPRRGRERRAQLGAHRRRRARHGPLRGARRTAATLRDLAAACGADRLAASAASSRSATRRSARHARRAGRRAQGREPRGEVTIVVAGASAGEGPPSRLRVSTRLAAGSTPSSRKASRAPRLRSRSPPRPACPAASSFARDRETQTTGAQTSRALYRHPRFPDRWRIGARMADRFDRYSPTRRAGAASFRPRNPTDRKIRLSSLVEVTG